MDWSPLIPSQGFHSQATSAVRTLTVPPCSGKSIAVTKTAKDDPGFDAEVDRVHGLVIKELQVRGGPGSPIVEAKRCLGS